jgi:hypothetical protein
MKVINGKWVNDQGDTLNTPEDHSQFQDALVRVKLFTKGKRLTDRKVNVLFNILSTDIDMDDALMSVMAMNKKQIKQLFQS